MKFLQVAQYICFLLLFKITTSFATFDSLPHLKIKPATAIYLDLFEEQNKKLSTRNDDEKALLAQKLEQVVQDYLTNYFLNATFMFSQGDEILIHGSKGVFSTDGIQLNANQIMPLASKNKTMIAVAILMLQDQGLLNVKDKIDKYLTNDIWNKNGKIPEFISNITIHQLLTHSSGLADYMQQMDLKDSIDSQRISSWVVDFILKSELEFTPGSKYKFSHTNFLLLQLIIEQVNGKNLDSFAAENFFDPLNAYSTSVASVEEMMEIRNNYDSEYPKRYFVTPNNTSRPIFNEALIEGVLPSMGVGILSNTQDIVKLYGSLFKSQILSQTSRDLMLTKYFPVQNQLGGKTYIGYGVYITEYEDKTTIYHSYGKSFGVRSEFGYIPKFDLCYAILSNVSQQAPTESNIDLSLPQNKLDILYFLEYVLKNIL